MYKAFKALQCGYTTFVEINKLVNNKTYLDMRISELIEDSENALLTDEEDEAI